ncbi:MAG: MBL fold metallo-hydrolase [Anaerolineales bacterium]|nr:MBL fold metallo-hydrolase [Anaerolineales bacterium]
MIRERVAENVYVFTSEQYASVNAGAVIGPDWSVLIDTLPFPEETQEMRSFIEEELESDVRFIIYTHYHADHTFGACWFPEAVVLAHARTAELLDTRGREGLREAKEQNRALRDVELVLPHFVFDEGTLGLRLGERTLELVALPGHTSDGAGVLLNEEKVLFAGDIMMPVPYLVDGDYDTMVESLKSIPKMKLESLVQGHGDVILRGEVGTAVKENLNYLECISKAARKAGRRKDPLPVLEETELEECGKSRILLNGLAEELHWRNLEALLRRWYPEKAEQVLAA